jgi:hypothetical protein
MVGFFVFTVFAPGVGFDQWYYLEVRQVVMVHQFDPGHYLEVCGYSLVQKSLPYSLEHCLSYFLQGILVGLLLKEVLIFL